MTVGDRPTIRYHRVTTRRRSLRALQCPLEPELLVAEFAGELPPDVALAVREHVAVCETCGARSRNLRRPYELLGDLGAEPVEYVPDLRDAVRIGARSGRFRRRALHAAGVIGRGGTIGIAGAVGAALLVIFIVVSVFNASARPLTRSTANKLTKVPAAAPGGTLYAETDKLVTLRDAQGGSWAVAEVVAIGQRDGALLRSLPSSSANLRTGTQRDLPRAVALNPTGSLVVELTTAPGGGDGLVGIDAVSGALRFAVPLRLADGSALPAGAHASSLAFAPDGSVLYVGLTEPRAGDGVRAIAVNAADGSILRDLEPGVVTPAPMPPPVGSLPVQSFPNLLPKLKLDGLTATQAAGGQIAISADGQWLFDALELFHGATPSYALVRRIDTLTGQTVQELAIAGDFGIAQLVAGPAPVAGQTPLVYLAQGGSNAQLYVLDAGPKGPTLTGEVALGGPAAPEDTNFTGTMSLSPSADGTRVYLSQDVSADNGLIAGHDLWAVDLQTMQPLSHQLDSDSAGTVLGNGELGASVLPFVLRQGQVLVATPDMQGSTTPWFALSDGHPVIRLVGSRP